MIPAPDPPAGGSTRAAPDPPPPVGTWRGWYALVAGELAVLVLAFWALAVWARS